MEEETYLSFYKSFKHSTNKDPHIGANTHTNTHTRGTYGRVELLKKYQISTAHALPKILSFHTYRYGVVGKYVFVFGFQSTKTVSVAAS